MSTALPNETAFFRCVAAIKLSRPTKDVNPHIYFEGLEKSRAVFPSLTFKQQVQPIFNPEGKGDPFSFDFFYAWQLLAEYPFALAVKNWPGNRKVPWYHFEELTKAEDDMFVPLLPQDGHRTLITLGSAPEELAGGSIQKKIPEQHVVRLHLDRLGHRPRWDLRLEEDTTSGNMCSTEHRFLSMA